MQISKQLISLCIANDRKAQHRLYEQLLPYLRAVANRYLKDTSYAKDVLQESFVKIFKNIEQYNHQKAGFHLWSVRIVINTTINYNNRVIKFSVPTTVDTFANLTTTPKAIQNLSNEDLLTILKQMPNGYFEVFNLFIIDGYKHEEIAEILNISPASSRKKLSRAKKWLQDTFKNDSFKNGLNPLSFILN